MKTVNILFVFTFDFAFKIRITTLCFPLNNKTTCSVIIQICECKSDYILSVTSSMYNFILVTLSVTLSMYRIFICSFF